MTAQRWYDAWRWPNAGQSADLVMAAATLIMAMSGAVFAIVGRIEAWTTARKRPG